MLYGLQAFVRDRTTRPVVAGPGATLHVEEGRKQSLQDLERLAIVASWTPTTRMSRSLSEYLFELERCGYTSLVVSSCESQGPLEWPHGRPRGSVVVRRSNLGYDFGSWAAALNALPRSVLRTRHILLTNDSMLGPFFPLDDLLRTAEASPASVVGLTDSEQMGRSLQSYFMLFNGGVLADSAWRRFFRSVREQRSKMDVVFRYELKVSRLATSEAYGWKVLFPAERVEAHAQNPALVGWRDLLEAGFPFIKKTLWNDPSLHEEAEAAERYLKDTYGVEVSTWLNDPKPDESNDKEKLNEPIG